MVSDKISRKCDEVCKFDERLIDLDEAKQRIRLMREFTLDMVNDRTRVTVDLHLLQEKYYKLEEVGHDAHVNHKAEIADFNITLTEKERFIKDKESQIRYMKIWFERSTENAKRRIEELQKKVDELSKAAPVRGQKRRLDSWCDP